MKRLPILFALAIVTLSDVALAENRGGPYGQISGGGNLPRELDLGESTEPVDFESAGVGMVSLGYAARLGWRAEVEMAFRRNEAEDLGGTEEARTGMANLWYDFRAPAFVPRLRPYLGAGMGAAEIDVDLRDPGGAQRSIDDTATAYQAGAGLSYEATRNLVLSLGYRYLATDEMRFEGTPGTPPSVLDPGTPGTPAVNEAYRADSVLAGLRYVFGGRERRPVAAAAPARAEVASLETVVLRPVNFQFDRAELTAPSKATLDEIAARMAKRPDLKVTIQGYTDDRGSEQYNAQLGARRARAVRDYLASKGIPPANVEIASGGEARPVADNATTEGRAHNRRAEVLTPDTGTQDMRIIIKGPTEESVEAAEAEPR